jgi:arsenite methyltransferase
MARDRWAEWILERRFGGNAQAAATMPDALGKVRDRVLERAEIQPGETVLDVGCGDGLIAFGALERVGKDGRVIFSDISQDLLDVSRELAGADNLAPIADESVDVVTMRSVIIYVSDKRAAFGEFFRVLRPGGRLSMFEPINRFTYPEPEGVFMGLDVHEIWPLARRVRDRYNQMASDEAAMIDFDERDLLELANAAGFASVEVLLEASIQRGRIWGQEPPPLEQLLSAAPNPNAPTFDEVLGAEFSSEERERFLACVRPRYEAGEMTGRHAVAYLQARLTDSAGRAGTGRSRGQRHTRPRGSSNGRLRGRSRTDPADNGL